MSKDIIPEPISDPATSGIDLPEKVPVDGICSACESRSLASYPVLSAGGWFLVVKCQTCPHSVSREPWHRLGWVRLEEDEL